jgi:glucosamine--fructose-6-phosphate aminotransferase (isomerizing)
MCGIFGYIGKNALSHSLLGIKKLEYRGYDSAGVAFLLKALKIEKSVGKIEQLENQLDLNLPATCVIAHTRWATHGEVTVENAHPHASEDQTLALVHNGIIENHHEIKIKLKKAFKSQTDTECIVHLIDSFSKEGILKAISKTMLLLKGAFAVVLLSKKHPNTLFAFCHETTLALGRSKEGMCVASDPHAFDESIEEIAFLNDHQLVELTKNRVTVYDCELKEQMVEFKSFDLPKIKLSKEGFEHFMLKEIFEQPTTIKYTAAERLNFETCSTIPFLEKVDLKQFDRFLFLGCGSSYYASLVGKYLFQASGKSAEVEMASEFRSMEYTIDEKTLIIAISQSGETADLLAACDFVKGQNRKILAICNVQGSQLTRRADEVMLLRCGPEIGVASTKAFMSMLYALLILSLQLKDDPALIAQLKHLPMLLELVLDQKEKIEKLAKKYAQYEKFYFLGRHLLYPICLEGALKLKEIAYVFAEGIAAGEMKHGPIALIDENVPILSFCCNKKIFSKMVSNILEIKARKGQVIAISEKEIGYLLDSVDDLFELPNCDDRLAIFLATLFSQLFAYYFARIKDCEIDQPRNLAKSVTVE